MANERDREQGNPELTHAHSEGAPTAGRQGPGDAGGVTAGSDDAPDKHAQLAPEGPEVERQRPSRGSTEPPGERGPAYPGTRLDFEGEK